MNVDLPTLGKPTIATSAISLSSSRSQRSSPCSPCSANDGARRLLLRNRALPRPPSPAWAASHRSPWWRRSPSGSRLSWSSTTVPSGTLTSRSVPRAPWRLLPLPWVPFSPFRCGWSRNASNDATLRSATSQIDPPSPPSPPSGPPFATWASRRNATQPAPPSPPLTLMLHSSTKLDTPQGYGVPLRARVTRRAVELDRRREGCCGRDGSPCAFAETCSRIAAWGAHEKSTLTRSRHLVLEVR